MYAITPEGFLQVALDWQEMPAETDFLLTTVTAPSGSLPPEPRTIYRAMEQATPAYYTYFLQNIQNGIGTFQDEEIEQLLPTYLRPGLQLLRKRIVFEHYSQTEGERYFRADLLRLLGAKIYAPSFEALAYETLLLLNYDRQIAEWLAEGGQGRVYQMLVARHDDFFSDYGIFSTKHPDPAVAFINSFLNFVKLPFDEKKDLESLVHADLKKRSQQVLFYESLGTIKVFLKRPAEPKSQEGRMIFDFYMRNVTEQQKILHHLVFQLPARITAKCNEVFDTSIAAQLQRDYLDRPYLTALPFNTTGYFDHRFIDLSRHRLYDIDLPLAQANALWSLYATNKPAFYKELFIYRSPAEAFDEIKHSFAFHPSILGKRLPIAAELKTLFDQSQWHGFFALALSQIEGLFSEMASAIQPDQKYTGLPSKVAGVRAEYERAQNYLDYFQYYIPALRNNFMHYGYEEVDEWKCYDLLFDIRFLALMFEEIKTPLIQVNKLINQRNLIVFSDIDGFNLYFRLIGLVKVNGQYSQIQARVTEFEENFLADQISLFFVADIAQKWKEVYEDWSQQVFDLSEALGKPVRLHLLTKKDILDNTDNLKPYLEKALAEYYFTTYASLFSIYLFMKDVFSEVPHLSAEAKNALENFENHCKGEFEIVEAIETACKDALTLLRSE
ncbi:MAG TPA: hypothetical protein VHE34_16840 [Puia sp.]|uniref:hypothetical protein n=1 Tax=Puia sp. TaxID=2045100 RepID=UPI002C69A13C|nr:hypothetical protein [Puia sp.]HVU96900.1 hypothetical protein [Puia sp.]